MLNPSMQEQHGNFVEKLKKSDDEVGNVMYQTKRVSGRYQTQLRNVEKKSAPATNKGRNSKQKSTARQETSKVKAESLTEWQGQVRRAKQALQAEGYKGTLNLKKGRPMHNKSLQLSERGAVEQREAGAPHVSPASG